MSRMLVLCVLLLLTAQLSALAQRTQYVGTYGNAAGDDGVSDMLYTEIEIFDGRFSLRFATRDGVRESGRTGKMPLKQFYGTWEQDAQATGLDITYYRPGERRGAPPIANVEHYSPADGDMVVLHFKGGGEVRGIFTTKHFPDLPPMLCLAWGGHRNLVFANWRENRKGGVMIGNSTRRQ
ncbi:MAG: hypothetical protein KF744_14865 [Taibaiella sp.]|nr:hypothetical protein [Taibaiella sp.]